MVVAQRGERKVAVGVEVVGCRKGGVDLGNVCSVAAWVLWSEIWLGM